MESNYEDITEKHEDKSYPAWSKSTKTLLLQRDFISSINGIKSSI